MSNLAVVHTKRMVPKKNLNSLGINEKCERPSFNNVLISKCFFLNATQYFPQISDRASAGWSKIISIYKYLR